MDTSKMKTDWAETAYLLDTQRHFTKLEYLRAANNEMFEEMQRRMSNLIYGAIWPNTLGVVWEEYYEN